MTPRFPGNRSPLSSLRLCIAAVPALLLLTAAAPSAFAQTPTLIVVRAVPAKGASSGPLTPLKKEDIAEVKIGGKDAPVTDYVPVLKGPHNLQLMVLFDSMQMMGGNGQFDDIKTFFGDLPPNVEIGVGWMLQGKVRLVQPFTTDRTLAGNALVQQTMGQANNPKNDNGNPFRCIADLTNHWPSPDPNKLRAVLFFTDGIIRNNSTPQNGDQLNPDVEATANNLQRAGIIPYPFFYMDVVSPDPNRSEGGQLEGQQNYSQLDSATAGEGLYEGMFSPGSFGPLLNRLYSTLASEAVITVTAPGGPGKFNRLDIKSARADIKILGPENVTNGNVLKSK